MVETGNLSNRLKPYEYFFVFGFDFRMHSLAICLLYGEIIGYTSVSKVNIYVRATIALSSF